MRADHANDQYYRVTSGLWAGLVILYGGELAAADDSLQKTRSLAVQHGYSSMGGFLTLFIGIVSAMRGQADGLAQMCQDFEGSLSSDAVPDTAFIRNYLAQGYAFAGDVEAALASLAKAMEMAQQGGEQLELASMHLLKGNLLNGKSNSVEAENSFRASIEVARRQESKSWELRATTSLARLLDEQGKDDEARAMLADVYGWFTEGFDTADLRVAKELLDKLNA